MVTTVLISKLISKARRSGSILMGLKFWHLNGFSSMVPMTTKLRAGIEYHLDCEIFMPQKFLHPSCCSNKPRQRSFTFSKCNIDKYFILIFKSLIKLQL